jgi:hypothetical protein
LVQVEVEETGKKIVQFVHLLKRVEVLEEVETTLPMEALVVTEVEEVEEAKLYNGVLGKILHLLGVLVQQVEEEQ